MAASALAPALWNGWLTRIEEARRADSQAIWPRRAAIGRCGAFIVIALAAINALEVRAFSQGHIVAFGEIIRQSEELNNIAARLAIEDGSLVAGDVGGLLWTSRLRVYDLLGLTDPTVARTFNRDKPAFYEYIFGQVRPTFIKGHMQTLKLAALDRDPRFARDYELLLGEWRPDAPLEETGHLIFVRRDAIAGKADQVDSIRRELGPGFAASR